MLEWDRSHEFVLQQAFHERAEVILHFASHTPSVTELIALRRLVPIYSTMGPAAFRELVGCTGQHLLGDMAGRDARDCADAARRAGLSATVKNTSYVSYLAIDKTTGSVWLIENEEESRAVAESMIAAGVPIERVEA